MFSRQPLHLLVLVSATLAAIGCSQTSNSARTETTPPPTPVARQPASAALATVTEVDGKVLVELPLGTTQGLEPGAFLRVYDAKDADLLKGMVQVTEVLGPARAVARQIALADRQRPLATGDRALEIIDLANLVDPKAVEQAARTATSQQTAADSAESARYAALRAQLQRELDAQKLRYDSELASIRSQYEAQLKASDIAHGLDVQRRALAARTDLVAVKTALTEQVTAALATERRPTEERLAALIVERDNLRTQLDVLVQAQDSAAKRIADLVAQLAAKDGQHGEQVRAEVEARELLAGRVKELEDRLAGRPTTGPAVLSAEPGRGETVLERLNRLTNELAAAGAANRQQQTLLAETQVALDAAKRANTTLQDKLSALGDADGQARKLGDELTATKAKLATSEQQRGALELSRLEAERQLFDLAARVLRLAGSSPETIALQARLRDVLSESTKPGGNSP